MTRGRFGMRRAKRRGAGNCRATRRNRSRGTAFVIEPLETRRLLTISVSWNAASGSLAIANTDNAADTIVVGPYSLANKVYWAVFDPGFPTVDGFHDGNGTGLASAVTSIDIIDGIGNDTIDLSEVDGVDFSSLSDGAVTVDGGAGNDTITGTTEWGDYLFGGVGNDSILGGGGNDTIDGGPGNDSIDGGAGDDSIVGGGGTDSILGSDGNDYIDCTASAANQPCTISGGIGDDVIYGGAGDDSINGDDGNDQLYGGAGRDSIHGGTGDDYIDLGTLNAGQKPEVGFGDDGNDTMTATDGASYYGGDGNDSIVTGDGVETRDPFTNDLEAANLVHGGAGNDTIVGGKNYDSLYGDDGNDYITGAGDGPGHGDYLDGGTGDDTIEGNPANDTINGGAGDDSIDGNGGTDQIDAGTGNNVVNGVNDNGMPEGDHPAVSALSVPSGITMTSTVTITATASDLDDAVTQVDFMVDNGDGQPDILLGTDTDGSDGWSVTFYAGDYLHVGTDTFFAVATDAANYQGNTLSKTATVTNTLELSLPPAASAAGATTVTTGDVSRALAAAADRWKEAGADAQAVDAALGGVAVQVADLPGSELGSEAPGRITIDVNGAGYGWFVDQTPRNDREFSLQTAATERMASGDSAAANHVDLLTVVEHELGHLLGLTDLNSQATAHDVMAGTLGLSTRRTPDRNDADAINDASAGGSSKPNDLAASAILSVPEHEDSVAAASAAAIERWADHDLLDARLDAITSYRGAGPPGAGGVAKRMADIG